MPSMKLRAAAATVGLGLAVAIGSPVLAQDRTPTSTDTVAAAETDARIFEVRPDRGDDVEVLTLNCEARQPGDDATRVRTVCRWRAAKSERVAGYQLWRIVGDGERELVAERRANGRLAARDVVPANVRGVRYAVLGLDANGQIVAQSRVETIPIAGADDRR